MTPSAAPTYNYLPVVSGQVPFDSTTSVLSAHLVSSSMAASSSSSIPADHRHTGSPAVQDVVQHSDSDRRSVLCPTLSHACFEVWIAMELCDGGTLAEQLQRGFHCHPGSEQVDMVSLLAAMALCKACSADEAVRGCRQLWGLGSCKQFLTQPIGQLAESLVANVPYVRLRSVQD